MSESYTRTTRRYWRRASDPQPWWPWGLLPFLGLVIAYLVGAMLMAPRIEAEVRSEVAQRLDGNAFVSSVQSDGQDISVVATATAGQRNYIDALARSTRCSTWAGEKICPTVVRVELVEPAPDVTRADFNQAVAADAVETTGVMDVDSAGAIAIVGQPAEQADIELEPVVNRCNEQFSDLMSQSSIRFRSGSADIDTVSSDVLRRLAGVAEICPGTLRIQGHTDNRGDSEMNRALSQARANAVRDEIGRLGIDTNRVVAEGLGELQPIADNETVAGRALNRRIVISVEE